MKTARLHQRRFSKRTPFRWKSLLPAIFVMVTIAWGPDASAQMYTPHRLLPGGMDLQRSAMPPGQIGSERMMMRPEMRGYLQPVRFVVPDGAKVALFNNGTYRALDSVRPQANLYVGAVYRLKITDIPGRPGVEIFPSIEIINRLYPPPGKTQQFPVVVQISAGELIRVVEGSYVSRVTYLEDPETALPGEQVNDEQSYFQVALNEDPLKVAASLGKPMAIVRMGSRVPLAEPGPFELGQTPAQIPIVTPEQLTTDSSAGTTDPPVRRINHAHLSANEATVAPAIVSSDDVESQTSLGPLMPKRAPQIVEFSNAASTVSAKQPLIAPAVGESLLRTPRYVIPYRAETLQSNAKAKKAGQIVPQTRHRNIRTVGASQSQTRDFRPPIAKAKPAQSSDDQGQSIIRNNPYATTR